MKLCINLMTYAVDHKSYLDHLREGEMVFLRCVHVSEALTVRQSVDWSMQNANSINPII